jgi:hypothetical protein
MPKPSQVKNVFDYAGLARDAHQRLMQMEAHLEALVLERRMEGSRVIEDEHRIVPAGHEGNPSDVHVVQGEAWVCERIAISVPGATTGTVYFYRDTVAPNRLAEVCPLDANGMYADSFGNRLYLPERTKLIAIYEGAATGVTVFFNIQIRALKRNLNPITSEEAYAFAGPETEYDATNEEWASGADAEPHEERQGDKALEGESLGGDIAPPTPELPRPTAHFPSAAQTVERAIEYVEEFVDELV